MAVIVGIPDEIVGDRIVAHLIGENVTTELVEAQIKDELPGFMRPEYIVIADSYPRVQGTEKIDREALRQHGVEDAVYIGADPDPSP